MRSFTLVAPILPIAAPLLAMIAIGTAETANAQGRGRGPSEAIVKRLGSYFVDETAPEIDGAKKAVERLSTCALVERAATEGHLALLYVYDSGDLKTKREAFEVLLFGNEVVSVSLRCFKCARIDVAKNEAARKALARKLPLFVAYNAKGKCVGETSMRDYRVHTKPFISLIGRAAKGYAKASLASFAKSYRGVLNEIRLIEGRKRALSDARKRLEGSTDRRHKPKFAEIEKAEAETAIREQKLYEREAKLLEDAKVPERDAGAIRLGARQRGRRIP